MKLVLTNEQRETAIAGAANALENARDDGDTDAMEFMNEVMEVLNDGPEIEADTDIIEYIGDLIK